MQARTGLWALGGALAATAGLIASPRTYEAIRRRTPFVRDAIFGVEELDVPGAAEDVADPIDMREARLSLRARLAETVDAAPSGRLGEPSAPARPPRAPRPDSEPIRAEVEEARARLVQKARAAGLD
jgi:hypothetical protein